MAGCQPAYPPPPETVRVEVVETLHGVEFRDPYRWLEDQQFGATRAWIADQNTYAEEIIGDSPRREEVTRRLSVLMDRGSSGSPSRCREWEYFSLRRKGEELSAIYRRPAPEAPSPIDREAEYELVLETPAPRNGITLQVERVAQSPDCRLMTYSLREGGEDEVELRIRDLEQGEDLSDVFPRALYSSISYTPDGKQIYYSHRSREVGARIRIHTLGTPLSEDEEIFGEGYGPDKFISVTQADQGQLFLFRVGHGWSRSEVHYRDLRENGPVRSLVTDIDARFSPRFHDGMLYLFTNYEADNNRVMRVDLRQPEIQNWEEFLPEATDVMEGYRHINGKVYVNYLHDVSSQIKIFSESGVEEGQVPVPELSRASVRRFDDDSLLLTLSSFLQPSLTYRWSPATGEQTLWDAEQVEFEPESLSLRQVWFESPDGTRVPMFLVHRRDLTLDGTHPTLLTGYGGFNVAQAPRFDTTAVFWVERGGVFALANLRGGSEFGEKWHRAGNLENKQNVFDDFIAAAEWLISYRYTSAHRLAIRGGSNGGLLVASAFTQRPDLFRAVLCGFPDLDMVRFYTFTRSNNLPALFEYGNAALPEQFEFLSRYSPYQAVQQGVPYPAVMLTSGDRDTRVPPLQARKMAAVLQASSSSGFPVILRYHEEAGHAGGRGRPFSQRVADLAGEMTFALQQLGTEGGEGSPR